MVKAIFSNGFIDEYKGKRDVKAAWMIFDNQTGKVCASGHSMSVDAARKTASSHPAMVLHHRVSANGSTKIDADAIGICVNKLIKKYKAENAEHRARMGVEVVEL